MAKPAMYIISVAHQPTHLVMTGDHCNIPNSLAFLIAIVLAMTI
jgi:hypothetical protein